MADNILDVVTRLTFDVEDAELKAASNEVQKTVSKIAQLTQQQAAYEQKLRQTSRLEIAERKQIQAQIDRVKNAINQQTSALENQIISNKKLQSAISKEIGLIGRLNSQMDVLKQKRDIANDPAKIQAYNKQIAATQAQLTKLTTTGGGVFAGIGGALLQGVGIGTGIGLVTQAVSEITNFISASSEAAAQAEGVERAFARLNKPDLLDNLRAATKGTVNDLNLMKSAIQFNNFRLPLDKLATALEFARIRARDTGESVDFLVQSITTGLGRKSLLILDNLGISASELNEEVKKTGDFFEGTFNVIERGIAAAGEDIDTYAVKQAQLTANVENFGVTFGKVWNGVKLQIQSAIIDLITFNSNFDRAINRAKDENVELIQGQFSAASPERRVQIEQQLNRGLLNAQKELAQASSRQERDLFNSQIAQLKAQLAAIAKIKDDEAKKDTIRQKSLTEMTLAELETEKTFREELLKSLPVNSQEFKDQKKEVKEITDFIDSLTTKTKDAAKATDALKEAISKLNAEIRKTLRPATDDKKVPLDPLGFPIGEPAGQPFGSLTPDQIAFNQADAGRGVTFLTAEQIAAQKEAANEAEETEKQKQEKIIGYYRQAAEDIISTFQMITDARLNMVDAEIQITQARITAATELAKRGNTEVLENEMQNLTRLQEEREKIANRQLALNGLLAASSASLALVQSIQAVSKAAADGGALAPLTIAATVAALASGFALVAGLVSSFQGLTGNGFAEGGYTGEGGKYEAAGVVHKGEFVFNQEKTKQFMPLFQAIHNDKIKDIPVFGGSSSKNDFKGLEKKFDTMIDIMSNSNVDVQTTLDAYGFNQQVERLATRDKRRHSRR